MEGTGPKSATDEGEKGKERTNKRTKQGEEGSAGSWKELPRLVVEGIWEGKEHPMKPVQIAGAGVKCECEMQNAKCRMVRGRGRQPTKKKGEKGLNE